MGSIAAFRQELDRQVIERTYALWAHLSIDRRQR
jgi:hypothetical protein